MKYSMDFQYMPRGHDRPLDDGEIVGLSVDQSQFALIPAVGDYVQLEPMTSDADHARFSGRVKSRLFRYFGNEHCGINIVIEETDDAVWGGLIKE
ncbi:hypothetical protein [Sphingomonas alba]|uniref:PilZ domain-containing protein n=1 Tax=Sphingomonas alba TaxID=2908208 RepID=A0ABT0RN06_9SPHN|nr:hypothetical protein [Sphingomonas alba]MCL6684034.1 hypothetical protein [Sphingomonas alba]